MILFPIGFQFKLLRCDFFPPMSYKAVVAYRLAVEI